MPPRFRPLVAFPGTNSLGTPAPHASAEKGTQQPWSSMLRSQCTTELNLAGRNNCAAHVRKSAETVVQLSVSSHLQTKSPPIPPVLAPPPVPHSRRGGEYAIKGRWMPYLLLIGTWGRSRSRTRLLADRGRSGNSCRESGNDERRPCNTQSSQKRAPLGRLVRHPNSVIGYFVLRHFLRHWVLRPSSFAGGALQNRDRCLGLFVWDS